MTTFDQPRPITEPGEPLVRLRLSDNKPICPLCEKPGREYATGGSMCEHDWVWKYGKLIAVTKGSG